MAARTTWLDCAVTVYGGDGLTRGRRARQELNALRRVAKAARARLTDEWGGQPGDWRHDVSPLCDALESLDRVRRASGRQRKGGR